MGETAVLSSCVDAQGCILDPIQIKKSSAAKMRLADKTGNIALRKEAAAEQSFADRLGGRTALLSDELKLQILKQKEAGEAASPKDETAEKGAVVEDGKEVQEDKVPSPATPTKKRNKQPQQAQQAQQTTLPATQDIAAITASMPPEAIMLKMDAATKQSIADKTGNLALKRTAALEQSLADKMAYANASASGVTTAALHAGRKGFVVEANKVQTQGKKPEPQSPPAQQVVSQPPVQPKPQQQPQQQQVLPPQQFKWGSNKPTQPQQQPAKWGSTFQPQQPSLQQSMEKRKQRLQQQQQPQQQQRPRSTSPTPITPRPATAPFYKNSGLQRLREKQAMEKLREANNICKAPEVIQHNPLAPATAAM